MFKSSGNCKSVFFVYFPMLFEKDDPKLPKKRNVLSVYKKGKTRVELLPKSGEYY